MPKDYLRERISEIIGEVPNKNVVVDRFIETYNAPYRKYHNMNHIVKCLDSISYAIPIFDNYRIEGENLIQIAILYHDYVYNPLATNNELYSTSAIKRDFSFSHINREKRELISNMIVTNMMMRRSLSKKEQLTKNMTKRTFNLFSILVNLGFSPFSYEKGYATISLIIGLSLLITQYILFRKIDDIIGGVK